MSDKQLKQVMSEMPKGTKFVRSYKAMEGDVRVIVMLPNETFETRYTIEFNGEMAIAKLM